MSLKVGDIDIVQQALNSEYQIERLNRILDIVISRTQIGFTKEDLENADAEALKSLQRKYPNSGISVTKEAKYATTE